MLINHEILPNVFQANFRSCFIILINLSNPPAIATSLPRLSRFFNFCLSYNLSVEQRNINSDDKRRVKWLFPVNVNTMKVILEWMKYLIFAILSFLKYEMNLVFNILQCSMSRSLLLLLDTSTTVAVPSSFYFFSFSFLVFLSMLCSFPLIAFHSCAW